MRFGGVDRGALGQRRRRREKFPDFALFNASERNIRFRFALDDAASRTSNELLFRNACDGDSVGVGVGARRRAIFASFRRDVGPRFAPRSRVESRAFAAGFRRSVRRPDARRVRRFRISSARAARRNERGGVARSVERPVFVRRGGAARPAKRDGGRRGGRASVFAGGRSGAERLGAVDQRLSARDARNDVDFWNGVDFLFVGGFFV